MSLEIKKDFNRAPVCPKKLMDIFIENQEQIQTGSTRLFFNKTNNRWEFHLNGETVITSEDIERSKAQNEASPKPSSL